ncbi:MAG: hypothetical protein WBC33_08950 [Conexibacter sp.]
MLASCSAIVAELSAAIPQKFCRKPDAGATERGESRSGFLQEAARMRLGEPDPDLVEAIEETQSLFSDVVAPPAADLIRELRDSR